MTNSGFEKRLTKVIYNALNCHRLLNMHQMIIDFGFMVKYYAVDMFLRYKDKYALSEGYHGEIYWKLSYTTFGYSLYEVPYH